MLAPTVKRVSILGRKARPLMKDANQAMVDMAANKARYRYVLVNEVNVRKEHEMPQRLRNDFLEGAEKGLKTKTKTKTKQWKLC